MSKNCLVTTLKGTVNNSNLPRLKDYLNSVDLGLPSGLRWCKMNLDVAQQDGFATDELQYGSYFSWGNIVGHNTVGAYEIDYDFSTETYANTTGAALTGNIPADASYDAAKAMLGGNWRMPSATDFGELITNTDCIDAEGNVISSGTNIIIYNGTYGILLKSKINQEKLFLPASGYGNGSGYGNLKYPREQGHYSASTLSADTDKENSLIFYSNGLNVYTINRYRGVSIRPVIMLD